MTSGFFKLIMRDFLIGSAHSSWHTATEARLFRSCQGVCVLSHISDVTLRLWNLQGGVEHAPVGSVGSNLLVAADCQGKAGFWPTGRRSSLCTDNPLDS